MVGKSTAHGDGLAVESKDVRVIRVFAMSASEVWDDKVEADLVTIAAEALSADAIIPIAA